MVEKSYIMTINFDTWQNCSNIFSQISSFLTSEIFEGQRWYYSIWFEDETNPQSQKYFTGTTCMEKRTGV